MPNIETIQAYITLLKDTFTCLAAIVASGVAIVGLGTWRRQLTANAERELAGRVLIAVYKVRDALEGCRLYVPAEKRPDPKKSKKLHDIAFARLDDANANLAVESLEARAVWGYEEGVLSSLGFFSLTTLDMKLAYGSFYEKDIPPNEREDAYSILFTDRNIDNKNDYSHMINLAVKQAEDVLRPKLTLKQGKGGKKQWWHRFKKQKK